MDKPTKRSFKEQFLVNYKNVAIIFYTIRLGLIIILALFGGDQDIPTEFFVWIFSAITIVPAISIVLALIYRGQES